MLQGTADDVKTFKPHPHIIKAAIIQTATGLFLTFHRHNGIGAITLQKTINQNAI